MCRVTRVVTWYSERHLPYLMQYVVSRMTKVERDCDVYSLGTPLTMLLLWAHLTPLNWLSSAAGVTSLRTVNREVSFIRSCSFKYAFKVLYLVMSLTAIITKTQIIRSFKERFRLTMRLPKHCYVCILWYSKTCYSVFFKLLETHLR